MNTNYDNYDSPFHRVFESPIDRLIQDVKKRFCEKLRLKLEQLSDIHITEITHPMMSCYISVVLKIKFCEIRFNYEMDTKQFMESLQDNMFENKYIGDKIITVFSKFYEVSQMPGFGTRHGGDWENVENANQTARKEYERLRELYSNRIEREKKEYEEKKRRHAELIEKLF